MTESKVIFTFYQKIVPFLSLVIAFCFAEGSEHFAKEGKFIYGNFLEKRIGFLLQRNDSLLSQLVVDNEAECQERCLKHPKCLSVNHGLDASQIGKVQCELFSYGRSDFQSHLVSKTGFTHFRMKTKCTATSNPCDKYFACNPVIGNPARAHSCVCPKSDSVNVLYCDSGDIKCNALGMEAGTILNSQITSSGDYVDGAYPKSAGRLNNAGSWVPSVVASGRMWIMVDLLRPTTITAVATQGRHDTGSERFTSYQLHYRLNDQDAFTIYKEGGAEKTLQGNPDASTIVKIQLKEPFVAKYVRFFPKTWTTPNPGWRVELYGCYN